MDLLTLRREIEEQLTRRAIQSLPKTYDKTKRTVSVVVATETPSTVFDWERWDYVDEILLMDGMELPEGRTQVPLLDAHDRWSVKSVLGSITNFRTTEAKKEADLTFASTEEAQKAETLVAEGHLTDLSAGYKPLESIYVPKGESTVVNGRKFDGPVKVTKRWLLKEGSLVPIGADVMSVVRSPEIMQELVARGLQPNATDKQILEFLRELQKNNPPNNQRGASAMDKPGTVTPSGDPPVDIKAVERKARENERQRIEEFTAIESRFGKQVPNFKDLKKKANDEEWPTEKFAHEVLKAIPGSRSIEVPEDGGNAANLGLDKKQKQRYSIVRAIQQIGLHGSLDGLEKELSDEVAKRVGKKPDGFFIAPDVMAESRSTGLPLEIRQEIDAILIRSGISTRALNVTEASKGGYLVGTDVLTASMIELLRNLPLVAQMGARRLAGLVGNVAIPKQSGGATAYWLPESGEVPGTDQSFGQLLLTPHRLSADTVYQKELVNQTSLDVEAFVREDLMKVLIIEKDRAAINGLGAAGEPLGILNLTGLNTVTFGAAPTWAKYVDFWKEVAIDNAALGSLGYLTTPAAAAKAMITSKFTNTGFPIWEGGMNGMVMGSGRVGGYRAEATNQVPSDKVIFGNWGDLILADWALVDVVVDPFSLKKKGQVEITVHVWTDLGVRHAVSFCVSTDSGAQ